MAERLLAHRRPQPPRASRGGLSAPPRWRRRALLTGGVCAGILLTGVMSSAVLAGVDGRRHPAPGEMVELQDGRRLHAVVRGREHGGPAVILLAGVGSMIPHQRFLVEELATDATVVAYERAGIGWSDPGQDVSAASTVSDLRQLLLELEIGPPYVLVGHSLGAHHARVFADRWPADVAALVLVDPRPEDIGTQVPELSAEALGEEARVARAAALATRLGLRPVLKRLVDEEDLLRSWGHDSTTIAAVTARRADAKNLQGLATEVGSLREQDAAVRGAARPAAPSLILRAAEAQPEMPQSWHTEIETAHRTMARRLRSDFRTIEDVDHRSIVESRLGARSAAATIIEFRREASSQMVGPDGS